MRLSTNGRDLFYSWGGAQPSGFVRFPDAVGASGNLRLLVHHIDYRLNATDSGEQTWAQLWSWHAEDFWLIHELRLGGKPYTFYEVQKTLTGSE